MKYFVITDLRLSYDAEVQFQNFILLIRQNFIESDYVARISIFSDFQTPPHQGSLVDIRTAGMAIKLRIV